MTSPMRNLARQLALSALVIASALACWYVYAAVILGMLLEAL